MKYVNVLFLNNVVPACVVSILSACVAIGLVLGGFLPNSDSRWCMWFGATGYLFTFIVWHCRKLVFLDISCIKQADSIQKTDAIISMGAFLKNSKSMLVFWDSTYVTRLWCVFELSGFLHSRKPNSTTELAVCPLPLGVAFVLGHVSLTLFLFVLMTLEDAMDDAWVHILVVLVLGICCFTALAAACREYFRNVQEMQRQLTSFTCAQAKSQCCQKGHEGARAGSLCDREIILHCIIAWFGSVEEFELRVRNEVKTLLSQQLADNVFTYRLFLQLGSPFFWYRLGLVPSHREDYRKMIAELAYVFVYCFVVYPMMFKLCVLACAKLRTRCCSLYVDVLLSSAVVGLGAVFYVICWLVNIYVFQSPAREWDASIVSLCMWAPIAVALWRCFPVPL
ncbi:unnamed protein product [Symbiodinium pilosum]|uniref:Uncharacterized protein n=1 Tax=Symbiodinium pilosum TaxID=2952 RepID=A0A812Y3F7_SYMPI|nr:unnamed protein product [Symbiodinium pilosum]